MRLLSEQVYRAVDQSIHALLTLDRPLASRTILEDLPFEPKHLNFTTYRGRLVLATSRCTEDVVHIAVVTPPSSAAAGS